MWWWRIPFILHELHLTNMTALSASGVANLCNQCTSQTHRFFHFKLFIFVFNRQDVTFLDFTQPHSDACHDASG